MAPISKEYTRKLLRIYLEITDENITHIRDTSSALKDSRALTISSQPTDGSDKESERIAGKLSRAVNRARRASVKLVDSSPTSSASLPGGVREAVRLLLSTTTSALEAVIESNPDSNFITQSLDVLFVLSRTTCSAMLKARLHLRLRVLPPKTKQILSAVPLAHSTTSVELYTQTVALNLSIPFLREGCRRGLRTLEVWRGIGEENGGKSKSDGKVDPWKQLEEQEEMAITGCLLLYQDGGQTTYEAFQESIKNFLHVGSGFIIHTGETYLINGEMMAPDEGERYSLLVPVLAC
ncbi:hypothetical protein K435DRAFT_869981 [Dendrothele bispora CBS 962.96]|uniref:Uncharacterized protein n=1 Tax=Dendrothele bispora (strain CBS 962.96) TaxID=1314807 RepID=A0A4S8L844_DENBC|nr:hypothetical protein K435DRAFT_869981 [Dendrothele bispora CBS 962.96]